MNVESVPIDSVMLDPANTRRHGTRNLDAIKASLARFGQQKPIVIDGDGIVRAGNGTLEAARALGWETVQAVRTPLKGSEATAYAIADNRTAELAEWDTQALAEQLRALQSEDFGLEAVGYDDAEVDAMIEGLAGEIVGDEVGGSEGELSETYSRKIEAPIYEPKGEQPPVCDLADSSKTEELVDEIGEADLPEDVKAFLIAAAQRHRVFHFRNIAEFYCHASPEVQHLMERSGLVIIDFDKAIRNGFIHMTDRLGALADIELAGDGSDA